jgi:hypothetical protein
VEGIFTFSIRHRIKNSQIVLEKETDMDTKLEKQIVKALKGESIEALEATLATLAPDYETSKGAVDAAQKAHTQAEAQFTDLVRQGARTSDAGERHLLEGSKAEAKAMMIEAAENLSVVSHAHSKVVETLEQLKARKAELERRAVEQQIAGLLASAQEKLTALQTSFPRQANEIIGLVGQAQRLAGESLSVNFTLRTPFTTMDNLFHAVGTLTIGDRLPDLNETLTVRVVRPNALYAVGKTMTTSRRTVLDELWEGTVEIVQ